MGVHFAVATTGVNLLVLLVCSFNVSGVVTHVGNGLLDGHEIGFIGAINHDQLMIFNRPVRFFNAFYVRSIFNALFAHTTNAIYPEGVGCEIVLRIYL